MERGKLNTHTLNDPMAWTVDGAGPLPMCSITLCTHTDSVVCVCSADIMRKTPSVMLNKPYKPPQVVKP